MFQWLQASAIWLVPAAPLAACLWIVCVQQFVSRATAHRALVAGLSVSLLASLILLWVVVPANFKATASHAEAATHSTGASNAAESTDPAKQADHHGVTGSAVVYEVPGFQPWISVGNLQAHITLRVDAMSAIMLVMITSVSLLVAIFASSYMHGDPGYPRFFAAMALFVAMMCLLVQASDFLMLFLCWEGVGLCSYLLIGFWYDRPAAAAAAKKAFVVNRIGDFGLMIALIMIWSLFGSLDFSVVLESPERLREVLIGQAELITPICLLLLIGAIGKSAQFPLHIWLPDAMEGPTPVSALIHAATMVTAGVYLVARCAPLFVLSPAALQTVAAVGGATALLAAFTALTQHDLKRVLAYSTVSQLGLMFMSIGAAGADPVHLMQPAVTFAMFHLLTHAFFKAVLFLSAGSVMHAMGDVIDMRQFGGLRKSLPITHFAFLCGAASLAGFPLLAGFWSKDEILTVLFAAAQTDGPQRLFYSLMLVTALLTSLLTAFYTFRAYFLTFHGPEYFPAAAGEHPHDAPRPMAIPLLILAGGALLAGILLGPTHWYAGYLHATPTLPAPPEGHGTGLSLLMMAAGTIVGLGGMGLAYLLYGGGGVQLTAEQAAAEQPRGLLEEMSYTGLFLDQLYLYGVVRPLERLSALGSWIDRNIVDSLVDVVAYTPAVVAMVLRPLHGGLVQGYAVIMLLGLTACLISVLRGLTGTP